MNIIRQTFRRSEFVSESQWRELCEDLGLDPIAFEIEIAIIKDECKSH